MIIIVIAFPCKHAIGQIIYAVGLLCFNFLMPCEGRIKGITVPSKARTQFAAIYDSHSHLQPYMNKIIYEHSLWERKFCSLARLARVAVVSGKHEKYFSPSANLCRRALLFCRGSGVDRSNSEPHASRLNPGGLEEAQKGMLLATTHTPSQFLNPKGNAIRIQIHVSVFALVCPVVHSIFSCYTVFFRG